MVKGHAYLHSRDKPSATAGRSTLHETPLPDFSQKTLSILAPHPARFLQWRDAHMSNGSARKSIFGTALKLLKLTAEEWLDDKAPQMGAALDFYTVLSLSPLVLILLAIIGVIFRHDPAGAWTKLTEQMSYFLDKSAIQVVQDIVRTTSTPGK